MDNQEDTADMDLAALEAYLALRLPGFGGPYAARKFDTGQSNPTYRIEAPGITFALRRKPLGKLLKSAHAVDREFRVQLALAGSDVPVPGMYHLCRDDSVIGSMFYVMEYLDGRHFPEPSLPGASANFRTAVFGEMNRILAALHDIDVSGAGLADFGAPGNYVERQVFRWTQQYRATETGHIPEMEELIAALPQNMPPDDGRRSLVHGDFRIDNLMFDRSRPVCIGVLDWELSTIGHPFADLAAVIMQWRMPPGRDGRGLAGLDRAALGIPEDAAFIDTYCQRRGLAGIPDFHFFLAFSFFRMAAILQGVGKRALEGNASNPELGSKLGRCVPDFARRGLNALHG